MLDLKIPAVLEWVRERDPGVGNLPALGAVDGDPAILGLMTCLGEVLEEARESAPEQLAARLRNPAIAAQLGAALAQAGTARRLRVLGWVTEEGVPDQAAVLMAIFTAGPDGDFIRQELQALHRRAVLERMYAPERVEALLVACRSKEEFGDLI